MRATLTHRLAIGLLPTCVPALHWCWVRASAAWRIRDRKRTALIEQERPLADVFIHPDLNYYAGISEAYRLMCIKRGEEAARAALPKILELTGSATAQRPKA